MNLLGPVKILKLGGPIPCLSSAGVYSGVELRFISPFTDDRHDRPEETVAHEIGWCLLNKWLIIFGNICVRNNN